MEYLLDGTKVGNKRMTLLQAHFHLEVLIWVPPVVRSGFGWVKMKRGHTSCSEHIPIELWSRKEQEMEDSIGPPVVVKLGNSKDTMKTDCSDL